MGEKKRKEKKNQEKKRLKRRVKLGGGGLSMAGGNLAIYTESVSIKKELGDGKKGLQMTNFLGDIRTSTSINGMGLKIGPQKIRPQNWAWSRPSPVE